MKATNGILTTNKQPKFSDFITGESAQGLIRRATASPERAARITANLISAVSGSQKLRECEPASILSAALRGEAMNLDLALGQFAVVPYGKSANYQITAKGYKQLAIRSGLYDDFDVFDVREGEYKGRDPRTRQPIIKWIEDDDAREELPIVGYYAYYVLNAQYNHFFRSIYWTYDKILRHADRYSKAFDLAKYKKLLAGELSQEEAEKLRAGTPWYDDPNSTSAMKMAAKTLVIQILGDGIAPLSTELRQAVANDEAQEKEADFIPASSVPSRGADVIEIDAETGEVLDSADTPHKAENRPADAKEVKEGNTPAEKKKRAQRAAEGATGAVEAKSAYTDEPPAYTDDDDPFARFAQE